MSLVVIIVLLWIWCAIGAAGFFYAHDQAIEAAYSDEFAKRHARGDLGMALMFGIVFGPIALFVAYFATGFGEYGWRLR